MKKVQKAIADTGLTLVRGEGYFYFLETKIPEPGWKYGESIYVCYLSSLSIERWVQIAEQTMKTCRIPLDDRVNLA